MGDAEPCAAAARSVVKPGDVAGGDDAAVLHVADEDLGALREAGEEGAKVIQLAADAGAEAVVDEEGDLGAVGRDGSEVEEIGCAVVDLDGDVFCGGVSRGSLESKATSAWVGVGPSCCAKASEAGRARAKSVSERMRLSFDASFLLWIRRYEARPGAAMNAVASYRKKRDFLRGFGE